MPKGWNYISGTKIPSMSKGVTPFQPSGAGIHARTMGLRNTVRGVNNAISAVKGATYVGLLEAAAHLQRDIDSTTDGHRIPVGKTGKLRASWFVHRHPNSTAEMPMVLAGFDGAIAEYAVYVHEMTSPPYGLVSWNRPGSGPKFLEYGLKRNKEKIVAIVAANIKNILK